MSYDAIWDDTKAALAEAYRDFLGLAIGAAEAILVALVATFVARFLRRRAERGLAKTKLDTNLVALAANGVAIGTYAVGVTFVLALLGASWSALIAVLGAGTVVLSLALQDILRSFAAGVYLLLERPFAIGDRVRVRDVEGKVEGIDIRTTALRTDADERVLVPNATVFAEILTNRSAAGLGRTTVTLKGLGVPLGELPSALDQALAGVDGLPERALKLDVVAVNEDGVDVAVSVAHTPGADIVPALVTRLRERFPEASVVVGRS